MTYPWLVEAESRLARYAAGGRQAHALLLSGPRGLGKRELALREAAALLCLEGARPACGNCRSCRLMAGGAHPDFRLVTFGLNDRDQVRKEIVVDQVRELIASLQLTHSLSARKVALIHPADRLNRNAANALLKTLEEPAGSVVLLLVSNDDTQLPATVRSRCQAITVRQPDLSASVAWLVAERGLDEETSRIALEAGAGSPLVAAELVQSGTIDGYRAVRTVLAKLESEPAGISEAFDAVSAQEPADCWAWLSTATAARARDAAGTPLAAGVLRLYALANRNRRLAVTPVRHDLLLRDWLLQWAALAGA